MRILKSKKVKNINLTFHTYKFEDYAKLSIGDKSCFDNELKSVLISIDYGSKEIERCQNDIIIACQNNDKIVGFIHLLPTNYYKETSVDRFSQEKMYVDYIAVNPKYQGFGIATNLYATAFNVLKEDVKAKELSAVLFDEYSRRAFEKVANNFGFEMKENSLDGTITANMYNLSQKNNLCEETLNR